MNQRQPWRRVSLSAMTVALGVMGPAIAVRAQTPATQDASDHTVPSPQRLSAWLASPAGSGQPPNSILHWRATSKRVLQEEWKASLVADLKGRYSALAGMLASMPVTGRVPLPKVDGRWLEANARFDPMLQSGDHVLWVPRSKAVLVLLPDGHVCNVQHAPDQPIKAYLAACEADAADVAWVIQPDGAVFKHGIATWNEAAQVQPAPGAWIWAPSRQDDIATETSGKLARFLATQSGPPADYPWSLSRTLQPVAVSNRNEPHGLHHGSNSWGAVGLLEAPSARMEPVGTASLMYNRTVPYAAVKARLQPLDWLSVDFGYVSISDRLYGASEVSGKQSYKDKSLDLKLRLLPESARLPEVAVGWRDMVGTGMFASEYLVASKRFGNLDLTGGLAFGYMAGRHDVSNPLGWLSPRFKQRPPVDVGSGGQFNGKSYFRGKAAFFGGMEYQLPGERWLLKLEYEGNDYSAEPATRPIRQDTPLNVGLVYRYAPWIDLTVGFERGNRAMFTVSTHTQLDGMRTPKYLDPRAPAVKPSMPPVAAPPTRTAQDIEAITSASVRRIESDGQRWTVVLADPDIGYERPVVDKVAAVVHRDAPSQVQQIGVRVQQHDVAVADVEVDRQQWMRERSEYVPPEDRTENVRTVAPPPQAEPANAAVYQAPPAKALTYGLGLSYRQNLGGPNSFLLYQLAADLSFDLKLHPGTWLAGIGRLRVLDNYGRFHYTAPSDLPRVRTYVREYLVTSRFTVPNLQLNHFGKLGDDHFFLAYGGLLESMFAGVGGEYLYRPVNSRLAIGVDANRVRQRDFEQKLAMRDYQVNTGHVTAYWDTGVSDILLKLSAGQYLAGDRGVTVDVSRVFGNGVTMGAYATRTNVSAARFGEGSFDKGIYLNIPFDAMLPRSGGSTASIVYAPLIRDGGAKLVRRFNLFDMTRSRDARALSMGEAPP